DFPRRAPSPGSDEAERAQLLQHRRRQIIGRGGAGGTVVRRILGGEIAPALERPLRLPFRLDEFRIVAHQRVALAIILDHRLEAQDALAHANISLDHPIDAAAIEDLGAAARHVPRVEDVLPALAAALPLHLAQMRDVIDTDRQLDQMQRHAQAALAASARATLETGSRLNALDMNWPAAARRPRSTPVSMPRPVSI